MEIHNTTEYYDYFMFGDYIDIRLISYTKIYFIIQVFSITCYSITILLGLAGNGLVIWISGYKMKTVSAVWFLNLAIVDFITGIFLIFRIIQRFIEFKSISYFYMCSVSLTALFTNMVTSVHFLILISLDRCVSVMWPLWAKIHRTKRLAWNISGVAWLLNIIIFVLQFAFNVEFLSITECFLIFYPPKRIRYRVGVDVTLIVQNICIFAIPFLAIFVSYGLIVFKLRNRRLRSPRPFLIIAAILISFFVCWLPYHAWTLVSLGHYSWKTDQIMSEVCTILAYFNCAINPILYVFLSKGFRKNFVKSIPKRVEMILSTPGDFDNGSNENHINNRTNAGDTSV